MAKGAYRLRKRSAYTAVRHCMATLTVRMDESLSRFARVSTDCDATRGTRRGGSTDTRQGQGRQTLCSGVEGEGGAGEGKVEEVEDPSFEEGVACAGHGSDEGGAEDGNRTRMGLERVSEGREEFGLFPRVRGDRQRCRERLEWVEWVPCHRRGRSSEFETCFAQKLRNGISFRCSRNDAHRRRTHRQPTRPKAYRPSSRLKRTRQRSCSSPANVSTAHSHPRSLNSPRSCPAIKGCTLRGHKGDRRVQTGKGDRIQGVRGIGEPTVRARLTSLIATARRQHLQHPSSRRQGDRDEAGGDQCRL